MDYPGTATVAGRLPAAAASQAGGTSSLLQLTWAHLDSQLPLALGHHRVLWLGTGPLQAPGWRRKPGGRRVRTPVADLGQPEGRDGPRELGARIRLEGRRDGQLRAGLQVAPGWRKGQVRQGRPRKPARACLSEPASSNALRWHDQTWHNAG